MKVAPNPSTTLPERHTVTLPCCYTATTTTTSTPTALLHSPVGHRASDLKWRQTSMREPPHVPPRPTWRRRVPLRNPERGPGRSNQTRCSPIKPGRSPIKPGRFQINPGYFPIKHVRSLPGGGRATDTNPTMISLGRPSGGAAARHLRIWRLDRFRAVLFYYTTIILYFYTSMAERHLPVSRSATTILPGIQERLLAYVECHVRNHD